MSRLHSIAVSLLLCSAASAEETVLFDFESHALGDTIPMYDLYNGLNTESRAIIVADPADAANKVLHVVNKSWNTTVCLPLGPMTAEQLTGDYRYLVFDLYRPATDGEYKQFSARIGSDTIYADASFVSQGAAGQWVERSYPMAKVSNGSDKLFMGYNSIDAEYYIDNVRLVSGASMGLFADPEQTLRHHAGKCGKQIGVAVPLWRIDVSNDNLAETQAIAANFNLVVAENEMKPETVQPARGQFDFYHGDRLVSFARRHAMEVRGHTLVWHSQLPQWISSDGYKNDHGYTRDQLLTILRDHVTTVVAHYKGQVSEWDVVNECLDDDQSIVRTDPTAYKLRASVWQSVIGDDYIDSAFVWAHRADPDARLVLNDYGQEFMGKAKTTAFYNLVRRLLGSGVPIHGVGLQCHLTVGEDFDSTRFDDNVRRYAALGLRCTVTELDLSMPDVNAADARERQAGEYAAIARVMMNYAHCPSLVVWGLRDDQSWRGGEPLLFSSTMQPKPAFFALRSVYEQMADSLTTGVSPTTADSGPLRPTVDVYDTRGRVVARQMPCEQLNRLPKGVYIVGHRKIVVAL